jgi:hypothetical protein
MARNSSVRSKASLSLIKKGMRDDAVAHVNASAASPAQPECARLGKIASPPRRTNEARPQSLTISPRRVPLTSESAGIIRRAVSLGAGRKSRTNANDKKSNRHETNSTDRDIRHMSLRSDRLRSADAAQSVQLNAERGLMAAYVRCGKHQNQATDQP